MILRTQRHLYICIYTQHTRSTRHPWKKTQHITKGIILSLESATPVSTYTRYHIYKSRLQRQELMRDNNCKKYQISNSISYVLKFRFTIFNMYIPHLTLYNHHRVTKFIIIYIDNCIFESSFELNDVNKTKKVSSNHIFNFTFSIFC